MKNNILKFTFWKVVAVIIIVAGLYSTFIRFTQGLGASTNLSDAFPWGLWIGFDMLCGVGSPVLLFLPHFSVISWLSVV
jgi:Ni/Fe-hydrogenase subunit HybB-like protein